ncbi:MAG: type II toxin-antitoxin system HipA family toxin [Eggerthellaceae bacterium]|nr:type II toxin-antitoxin system HipA family toxin [Eggerthellaceae bacterium]
MTYKPVSSIEVLCWDVPVGVLAFDTRYGVYAFEYYNDFRRFGWELSPLLLPASTKGAVVFPHLARETFFGLPAFVADSLPDSFGNLLIDSWMAAQGIAKQQITSLDRLAYLGKRAMGALEFRPAIRDETKLPSALEISSLVETARRALLVELHHDAQNPETRLVSPGEDGDEPDREGLAQLIAIGTSAGGARAKAIVGYHEQSNSFVSGQFDLEPGFEHWIIKFDLSAADPAHTGNRQVYGRIEYAYYLMAQACGIEIQPCRLYEAAGRAHFMTRRFDRSETGGKLHLQTLCALAALDFNLRDTHDYHQAFMAVEDLGLDYYAADEMFRRMVFNVALANNDDHTKNLSFIMSADGVWNLAPAYDLTHAYNPTGLWTSRHLMAVNGKFRDIERDDLMEMARRYHVSTPKGIVDAVLDVARDWPVFAQQAGLPEEKTAAIASDIGECCRLLRPI